MTDVDRQIDSQIDSQTVAIPEDHAGERLDKVLAILFPDYSRSRLQTWLKEGHILLDGEPVAARTKVLSGQVLQVSLPERIEVKTIAQPLPLDVLYADDDIIIINKAAGRVVHPAAGNADGTLQNALLHHFPETAHLPRAGIVHRLDKETTGVMVVARSERAHKHLVEQLQDHSMGREYLALVDGVLVAGSTIETEMGRHPVDRKRRAVLQFGGKVAITHYRVEQRLSPYTLLRVSLETGRTHQIRVHMAHIRKPIVGDPLYGGRLKLPKGASEELKQALRAFPRQALHAETLHLIHPHTEAAMHFTVPMPDDMQQLLQCLKAELQNPAYGK
ncbi:MAG: 23S rRNA pseudouridine(1911/1915/1917) synthase RluD [Gammaproteobacteria bacterium]|nr:23S rRNA pseudouridine(1911/1915/1917) synthase RluD [Gammaproteobacteria bacterium]